MIHFCSLYWHFTSRVKLVLEVYHMNVIADLGEISLHLRFAFLYRLEKQPLLLQQRKLW